MKFMLPILLVLLCGCAGSPASRGEPFPRIPPLPGQPQCTDYTVNGQLERVCTRP